MGGGGVRRRLRAFRAAAIYPEWLLHECAPFVGLGYEADASTPVEERQRQTVRLNGDTESQPSEQVADLTCKPLTSR